MLRLWKIIGMLVPLRPLITICVCVSGNMMRGEIQQKTNTNTNTNANTNTHTIHVASKRIVYIESEYQIAAPAYQRYLK